MHEFSIAQDLAGAVLEEYAKLGRPGARLLRVRVVIGMLHQVVPGSLELAYEALVRGTPCEGSALDIEWIAVEGECKKCGWTGEMKVPFFVCGSCGSGDIRVGKGKELHLDQLEIA